MFPTFNKEKFAYIISFRNKQTTCTVDFYFLSYNINAKSME